ncbi:MAG TPA: AgmX/PglI C-terminal domain-containing protein [Kofleriaceae bacterium]|nr:AgmX/PglI C-terminal domain-containing protein [Kofleriaceae bacterium]
MRRGARDRGFLGARLGVGGALGLLALGLGSGAGCGGATSAGGGTTAPKDSRDRAQELAAEDDGVTLQSSRGVLEPEQIRAVVEPHTNELSACYVSRVGDRRWLGGRVTLKWELGEGGEVRSVQIADSDLGAWPVEKCLLSVSRRLRFPAPRGGATDFTVPLEFSATGQAAVWGEAQSAAAVGGQLAKLDACGAEEPTAPGKDPSPTQAAEALAPREVLLTLYLGAQGQVLSAGFAVEEAAGFTDRWAECAHKAALSWRLTEPRVPVAKLSVRYLQAVAP